MEAMEPHTDAQATRSDADAGDQDDGNRDRKKLSDMGYISIEELQNLMCWMGDIRGTETKEVLSLGCKQPSVATAIILGWGGLGRTGSGEGINRANFDMLTLTCFSSIQVGGLHNPWHMERVRSMGQKEEGKRRCTWAITA